MHEMVSAVLWTFFVLTIIALVCVGGYYVYLVFKRVYKSTDDKLKDVVDQINSSSMYTYRFDKTQESNIKNMEKNINSVANNYDLMKNDWIDIKGDYMSKKEVKKAIETDKAVVGGALHVSGFRMSTEAPSSLKEGSAKGEDWLYLSGGTGMGFESVRAGKATIKDAKVAGELGVDKRVRVGGEGEVVFGGDNRWVVKAPADGRKSLVVAPGGGNAGEYEWSKQAAFEDGYMSAWGGGMNVRGGRSRYNTQNLGTHFPHKDTMKNHIRGDTELQGDMELHGAVKMVRGDPGPMIEKNYGRDSDRYGVGQFGGGTMRVYTAGFHGPASLNLSVARDSGGFDDVLKVRTDRSVEVDGATRFKRPASFDGPACIGAVCIRESGGQLQACNRDLTSCKRLVVA